MSFLVHKKIVHCIYTQNIDSLELKAKIPREKIVYAHGHINEAHCPGCKIEIDIELQNNHIKEGKVLYCNDQSCNMPCKPKIVFYGEKLPDDFKEKSKTIGESDLTFIMGTSLMVSPFNMLPHFLSEDAWRVVINKEKVGSEGPSGFSYDDVLSRDIFIPGTTDDILKKLIMDCGWKQEFESFMESYSSE